VKFSTVLRNNRDYEIASQLIRCGTSVGANVRESQRGSSTKDFTHKLKIALKEAEEVEYWLDIIDATRDYELDNLYKQIDEVIRLLVSIIKSSGNS
jgi:four helix bundle protein